MVKYDFMKGNRVPKFNSIQSTQTYTHNHHCCIRFEWQRFLGILIYLIYFTPSHHIHSQTIPEFIPFIGNPKNQQHHHPAQPQTIIEH